MEKLALSGKCTAHYPKEGGVHYSLLNDVRDLSITRPCVPTRQPFRSLASLCPQPTQGCRLANWLGLVLLLTAVAGAFAVLPNISSSHHNGGGRSSPHRVRNATVHARGGGFCCLASVALMLL